MASSLDADAEAEGEGAGEGDFDDDADIEAEAPTATILDSLSLTSEMLSGLFASSALELDASLFEDDVFVFWTGDDPPEDPVVELEVLAVVLEPVVFVAVTRVVLAKRDSLPKGKM